MKKTLPILMAAVFWMSMAVPAFATDWNLFGQIRLQTFWSDYSEERPGALSDTTRFSGHRGNTMQSSYSRFGGNVKHETIRGGFEVGSAGLTAMNIRLLYGAVKLGEGELLVGQWYGPYGLGSLAVSKDVYNHHSGWGTMGTHFLGYACRVPLVQYKIGGFAIAAVQPDTTFSNDVFADPERQIPQIQASYDGGMDKTKFHVAGAYQTYKENANNAWNGERLDAWGVTANVRLAQMDPVYLNLGGYYGENVGALGQFDGIAGRGGAGNVYPSLAPAIVDGSVEDTDTWAGIVVLGYNGPIGGEIGVGHLVSDNDVWPSKDKMTHFYGQLRIPLTHAGHAMIVPQVGYFDYHDNNLGQDAGDTMYVGASWQIFF
jgi:hypothetical protein